MTLTTVNFATSLLSLQHY
ncbi:unnamed protein product [Callosobruchus maculatus]|uniref:Uncharacterized protein n=1 Tax=Callosobruchus maculatus TaxID=64391 RepID=A0A653DA99_CALMS|nr:unnamed protein product [Callosobruchus maculatus]